MQALVFSAGGCFGAYQAGAARAFEEIGFRPEILVGTSAGALNAAALARGCPADRLQEWWSDPGTDVFRWNWPPRGMGLFTNGLLEARIDKLLGKLPPPAAGIKLLVTLTELPSLKIRVFSGNDVTPRVLLASCAIPGIFPPVRIGGRWYCDGGLFCRMPLAVAVEAGATEIVAVDLLADPPSRVVRGLVNAAIRLRGAQHLMSVPPGVLLRLLTPRPPLGRLRDILHWDQGEVERWIEAGFRDAMASAAQPSRPMMEMAAPR